MGRSQEQEWLDEALAALGEEPSTELDWRNFGEDSDFGVINGLEDAEERAQVIADTRQGARGRRRVRATEPRTKPAHRRDQEAADGKAWEAYRRRLFVRAAGINARFARGLFGLKGPVQPEELPALLRRAREVERREGDELRLAVPAIEDGRIVIAEEWTVYRGHVADALGERELPQPLAFLASRAARLAAKVGVEQADAVLYLLCDIVPWWPPARAFVEWRPRFAVVVRCEWPFVDPKTVADLFVRVRGSLYGLPHDADTETRRAVGTRVMSAELVHFVAERRRREQTWKQIHAAWEKTYPDKHFKSELSLRRTYVEAEKRLPDMTLTGAPWRPRPDSKEER